MSITDHRILSEEVTERHLPRKVRLFNVKETVLGFQ